MRHVVLGGAPLGDLVDLGLRPVDDVVDVAACRPRRSPSARCGCRPRPAGAGSPARRRSRRSSRRWPRSARWRSACAGTARRRPAPSSPVRVSSADDGDRVGRLAPAVQVEDRVVDQLVRRPVEVGRPRSTSTTSAIASLRQQHRRRARTARPRRPAAGCGRGRSRSRRRSRLLGRSARAARRHSRRGLPRARTDVAVPAGHVYGAPPTARGCAVAWRPVRVVRHPIRARCPRVLPNPGNGRDVAGVTPCPLWTALWTDCVRRAIETFTMLWTTLG